MAINISALNITLDGTGTEIPTLNVTDPYEKYYLLGSGIIAIGNYAIVPTGTPINGTTFIFKYRADVDITTNSTTFSIFGQSLTQNQLNSVLDIECYYDGTSWEVEIKPSFTSAVVEATNIVANAITASAIANSSIDLGVKGIVGSLVNNRIANSTIIASQKVQNLSITDALINDVNGSKIATNSVANNKLTQMVDGTVKGNISGSTASPSDISITTLFNSNGWGISGNSGTSPGTNFIGTTDGQDLVFKVNSIQSGRISSSTSNTLFGKNALLSLTIGDINTAFGNQALYSNTTGSQNIGVGHDSLYSNTTGTNNIGIGTNALTTMNSGDNNIGIGYRTGVSLDGGNDNTCIGYNADVDSSSASNRIALGSGAIADSDNIFALPDNVTKFKYRGVTYTWPSADGTAGQKLTTDGSGNLSWT